MTDEERQTITIMRKNNVGYKRIAKETGINLNSVKAYCRRNDLKGVSKRRESGNIDVCLNCGKEIEQTPGRKQKKFCSDKCRMKWWNSHLDLVNKKATYEFTCKYCKKQFTAYGNANRKYCSHECYIEDRFGGAN